MKITEVKPNTNFTFQVTFDDKRKGTFDVSPYLEYETFRELKNINSFKKIMNGGYFVEWDCGADLSIDTIEAHLKLLND